MVWNPEQYERGKYFQNETSEQFRKNFPVEPHGTILDIGCGDGQYINMLAHQMKHGHILAIDSSAGMISHANQYWSSKNLTFKVDDIEHFYQFETFDFVLSFWCLHWTNVEKSFPNIFQTLKKGGRLYAILSSLSDNSILQTCRELTKQNRYPELTENYINSNNQYENFFYRVLNILNQLPFKQVKINLQTTRVLFPDINYFRNLLLTMPFFKTVSSEIIEDLLLVFKNICLRKYNGSLYYETRPILIEAVK